MLTILPNTVIAQGTYAHLGRTMNVVEGFERLLCRLLDIPSKPNEITLDELLGNTRILKDDYDAVNTEVYGDGTIVNERIDSNGQPYARIICYPTKSVTFSYRLHMRNQDGDYLFSAEKRVPDGWTGLDLNGFLSRKKDFYSDSSSDFRLD